MSDVTVTINRRPYRVACEDGQEDHLRSLARLVDERVAELTGSVGQVGDQRLLVMASLLFADDAADARRSLDEARDRIEALTATEAATGRAADGIEDLATRIESLADALEKD